MLIFNLYLINLLILLFQFKKNNMEIFLFGVIINQLINGILKRIINLPRPVFENGTTKYKYCKSYFGMPSGHAQFYGFLSYYLYNYNISFTPLILLIGSIELFYKYKTECHDLLQLFIGYLIGYIIGFIFNKFIKIEY